MAVKANTNNERESTSMKREDEAKAPEDLTSKNVTSTGTETKQSGLENERLEKDSMDDSHNSSKRLSIKYNMQCGSQSYDGRRKSLINLEINSGPLPPPKVVCKTVFVKQRVEMSSVALAEEIVEAAHASSAHREEDLRMFDRGDSPPSEGKPHIREQPFQKKSKRVRFKAQPEILSGTTSSATDKVCPMKDDIGVAGTHSVMSSYTGHSWAVRKPSTFTEQFRALTHNDLQSAGNNDCPLPIPEFKPKWHGGGPCLPSIRPGRRRSSMTFSKSHRRKMQREMEEDFEGWGEPEPNEVKRILGRPLSAKLPHYPANWDRLPKERPLGGAAKGTSWDWIGTNPKAEVSYQMLHLKVRTCYIVLKLTRNNEKQEDVFQANIERQEPPRRRLFADCQAFPSHDSIVQEPATWCRASRLPKPLSQHPPSKTAAHDEVDLVDVENTPELL
ncbi:hypothetical protein OS493_010126 [Desmophyllum pertusum]|uniref:Uncharacterized protein n=1 Tax=Desmophyllum pertusum TaxID=174260 RepID=A0A9W9YEG7_9CNID|nr:hypothetical protein OS493_010126 [Desmophyllum pertusum]